MAKRTRARIGRLVVLPLALALLLAASPPGAAQAPLPLWRDAGGAPLPFGSHEEAEAFLLQARVVESEHFGEGITGLRRLVLEYDGVSARAAFHEFHEITRDTVVNERRHLEYHDSYLGQCAAYALARLLGLGNVPPTVCRRVDGAEGSLQLWVEGSMQEAQRLESGLEPPDFRSWLRQVQRMNLFDALAFNDDRHARNFLVDGDWRLWMIDHTRAFQHGNELPEPLAFAYCERPVWDRLRSLTDEEIRAGLGRYLDVAQLTSLLRRRARLVEIIEQRIAERGEGATLIEAVTGR